MKRNSAFVFAALVSATLVCAQTNQAARPVRSLSLQDCIQMALEHNLDVKIQRVNPQIARNNLDAAIAGYDPAFSVSGVHNFSLSSGSIDPNTHLANPSSTTDQNSFSSSLGGLTPFGLRYSLSGNMSESYGSISGFGFDSTRGQVGIQLTQPLLKNFWIDGTRLNISIAKIQLKGTEQQLRGQILDTVNNVEQAYYTLIAARENVIVQQKALQLAEQQLSEDSKRVELGALAPLSETQDESQAASVRAALIAAVQQVGTDENILIQLIAEDFGKLHEFEIQPTESLSVPPSALDLQASWRRALTDRPDIMQSKFSMEQAGIELKYSRNQLWPELDLVGSYGHVAGGATVSEFTQGFDNLRRGNQPFYSYGAQMTIPLGNGSARASYRSAKLTVDQSLLTLKRLEQTVMATIANGVGQARANFLQIESTREATKYAEAALDAEKKKLENGKSTNFEVLQLQKNLTSARSDEINALASYNKTLSQLAHDEASTFQRRNINLQIK